MVCIVLKVAWNEKGGVSGRWHTLGTGLGQWRSIFFCVFILSSSFRWGISVSAKSLKINWQWQLLAQHMIKKMMLCIAYSKYERFLLQYVDTTMHLALIGNADRICCVYNLQIIFCDYFFSIFCALFNNAAWFGASIGIPHYKERKNCMKQLAQFCLFMEPSPINFTLYSGNGNKPKKRRWQN